MSNTISIIKKELQRRIRKYKQEEIDERPEDGFEDYESEITSRVYIMLIEELESILNMINMIETAKEKSSKENSW